MIGERARAGVGMLANMLTRRIARRESMPPSGGARITCHTRGIFANTLATYATISVVQRP